MEIVREDKFRNNIAIAESDPMELLQYMQTRYLVRVPEGIRTGDGWVLGVGGPFGEGSLVDFHAGVTEVELQQQELIGRFAPGAAGADDGAAGLHFVFLQDVKECVFGF